MNGDLECAFFGAVGRAPELRTSKSGKPWCFFPVRVGQDDAAQWVKVAAFGETAEGLCRTLQKGDRVYCEGRLTAGIWAPEGKPPRVSLDCAAWKAEKLGQIGRNKVKRTTAAEDRRGDWPC
jgi:single-stranded DNA-binding protein